MSTRVHVFIDYQNVRYGAREVFGGSSRPPPTFGEVVPERLGELLVEAGRPVGAQRELTAVSVFTGEPGGRSSARRRSAFNRQRRAWQAQSTVAVKTRPLRYAPVEWLDGQPTRWRAREKGIDVMMALDIAFGARDDLYDVGIVVSADGDLVPALDVAIAAGKRIETAMWWSDEHRTRRLETNGRRLWNHRLTAAHFEQVRDDTDYTIRR